MSEFAAIALTAVGIGGRLGTVMLVVGTIVVAVTASSNPFSGQNGSSPTNSAVIGRYPTA